jgi:hypothetical protein
LWSVKYAAQYQDEDDDEEGGQLDDKVTLNDLEIGKRLCTKSIYVSIN